MGRAMQARVKGDAAYNRRRATTYLLRALDVYTPENGVMKHAGIHLEVKLLDCLYALRTPLLLECGWCSGHPSRDQSAELSVRKRTFVIQDRIDWWH